MDKKKQVFEELKAKQIDIQLVFMKHLLDTEVTVEKMGEFALQYMQLSVAEQWEVAKELNDDCNCGLDTWPRFFKTKYNQIDAYYNENTLRTLFLKVFSLFFSYPSFLKLSTIVEYCLTKQLYNLHFFY